MSAFFSILANIQTFVIRFFDVKIVFIGQNKSEVHMEKEAFFDVLKSGRRISHFEGSKL